MTSVQPTDGWTLVSFLVCCVRSNPQPVLPYIPYFSGNSVRTMKMLAARMMKFIGRPMRIVFADDETTAISSAVSNAAVREGKFVENGRVVIVKNGVKYNVAGQAVK